MNKKQIIEVAKDIAKKHDYNYDKATLTMKGALDYFASELETLWSREHEIIIDKNKKLMDFYDRWERGEILSQNELKDLMEPPISTPSQNKL